MLLTVYRYVSYYLFYRSDATWNDSSRPTRFKSGITSTAESGFLPDHIPAGYYTAAATSTSPNITGQHAWLSVTRQERRGGPYTAKSTPQTTSTSPTDTGVTKSRSSPRTTSLVTPLRFPLRYR